MKKLIFVAIAMSLFGCDSNESNPVNPVSQSRPMVVVNFSDTQETHSLNVTGRILQKSASSSTNSGFNAVVCLENAKICAKTNSSGQYQIKKPQTTSLISARSFARIDTVITPERIVDTVKTDTTITIDTIIRNDTVYVYHNMLISNSNSIYNDSAIVYSNARILYEIPVTSWNSVLPDRYIVQRNISGMIYKNEYFKNITKVQAVYFGKDSLAYVINLEKIDLSYSGFIYEPYDDSSFRTGNKTNNLFVRILDFNDTVWGISNVVSYSERSGDLNNVFSMIVPGAIQKYPKPSVFAVLQDGNSVKTVIGNLKSILVSGWSAIDSVFLTNQSSIDSSFTNEHLGFNRTAISYQLSSSYKVIVDSGKVDSFEISFYSPRSFSTSLIMDRDSASRIAARNVVADSGMNYFRFQYNWNGCEKFMNHEDIWVWVTSLEISDLKVRLHFK